jgi:hypothetical protein
LDDTVQAVDSPAFLFWFASVLVEFCSLRDVVDADVSIELSNLLNLDAQLTRNSSPPDVLPTVNPIEEGNSIDRNIFYTQQTSTQKEEEEEEEICHFLLFLDGKEIEHS